MSTEAITVPAAGTQDLIGFILWELPTRIESLALVSSVTVALAVVVLILLRGPRSRTRGAERRTAERHTQYSKLNLHAGAIQDFRARFARSGP